ncbi:MAG: DegV family protein [Bacilli bacterium]|nr:DegV family protein [Bacilli bacterium]
MRKIQIMTDSCADFDDSFSKKYDIACIDFTIFFRDREINVDVGYDHKVKARDIFGALRNGERIYTLPATEYEIEKKLRMYLDQDMDILYIGCSAKQSVTVTKVNKVAKRLAKEYENNIEVIDSLNAGAGEGLLVIEACKKLEEGFNLEELKKYIYSVRKNVIQFAVPENLSFMSRANKINAGTAIIGNMLGVKPVLISDKNGVQCALKNVRGREESLQEIVKLFKENILDSEKQDITIIHGDDEEAALYVKNLLLQDDFKCQNVFTICIGPSVGITMGPGMVGIFGFGKTVTFEQED